MKYIYLTLLLVVFFRLDTLAQHCPFDGGHLILVYLTDAKGKPLADNKNLILVEKNNPAPQFCSYAEGLLNKSFAPTKGYLQKRYERHWKNGIEAEYKDWIAFNPGYYAVALNMAEETCMIKKDNDFNYRKREFQIQFMSNGTKKFVKIPAKQIYPLCTNAGKWTRIEPIKIKLGG